MRVIEIKTLHFAHVLMDISTIPQIRTQIVFHVPFSVPHALYLLTIACSVEEIELEEIAIVQQAHTKMERAIIVLFVTLLAQHVPN